MKTAILLAAGALASPAVAGVHKMKLQKVPLSEQLVSPQPCRLAVATQSHNPQKHANIQEQAKALGQKYMGVRPETHADQVFKAPYVADGTHPVPVTNFLNAQCTSHSHCSLAAPLGSN